MLDTSQISMLTTMDEIGGVTTVPIALPQIPQPVLKQMKNKKVQTSALKDEEAIKKTTSATYAT